MEAILDRKIVFPSMTDRSSYYCEIEQFGFSTVEAVIDADRISSLRNSLLSAIQNTDAKCYGMRRLLEAIPIVHQLCYTISPKLCDSR